MFLYCFTDYYSFLMLIISHFLLIIIIIILAITIIIEIEQVRNFSKFQDFFQILEQLLTNLILWEREDLRDFVSLIKAK